MSSVGLPHPLALLMLVGLPAIGFAAVVVVSSFLDPSIWIAKRSGLGWTVNPDHPLAGLVQAALVGALIVGAGIGVLAVRLTSGR